jgi:hypothetical protein
MPMRTQAQISCAPAIAVHGLISLTIACAVYLSRTLAQRLVSQFLISRIEERVKTASLLQCV